MDTTQPCSAFQTVHSHQRWSLLLECLQMCRLYFPLRKRVPQIYLSYHHRLGNGCRQYLPSVCSVSGSALRAVLDSTVQWHLVPRRGVRSNFPQPGFRGFAF